MGERERGSTNTPTMEAHECETVFFHAGQPLFLVDVMRSNEGVRFEIRGFNAAYEDASKIPVDGARGRTPREWLGEELGAKLESKYCACVERRARLRYEEELELPHGPEVWETTLSPVVVDGEVRQLVGTTREVTERRRIERERARSRELLRQTETLANTGGWEFDVLTDNLRWTRGTRRLFGVSEAFEPTLEDALEFYHPDDRDSMQEAIERCLTDGDPYDLEARIVRDDGTERWLRSRGEAIEENGRIVTLRGAIHDVTTRREHERELERQNERLAEFASVVSHDLRNPLNVAQGMLSLATDECESDHLESVTDALDRIEAIVGDTLALAREGQAVTTTTWVDLEATANRCWRMVDTAEATLEVELEGRARASADRLQRICENLFRNAVEHGGDDVTVRVGRLEDGIYLEDDGPGIPPDAREAVFEPGYTTSGDGTGFGLAIVKRIAEAHGWTVSVTDATAGGARFEISGIEFEPA